MVRFVCVLLVSTANSSANTERPVVTVEELLRLDTEAALVAARRSVVG
ncbi:MAG: hypothetical protein RLZZ192_656, partial [Pseudomonadota bacterium]